MIPPIEGLREAGYWTNREATALTEIPASAVIVGGGPVGIELAQFLRRFGSEVAIVPGADRLAEREDEHCKVADGVWAAGDCTGKLQFTHVAKYQARVAMADMRGRPVAADYRAIPRVIFTDPEVASVGLTEAQAREAGHDVVTTQISLPTAIARPSTYEQNPRGEFGVVADRARRLLLGAWAVAPLAGEWIHQAVLAIRADVPIDVLLQTVAQFPSYSEAYLSALQALEI